MRAEITDIHEMFFFGMKRTLPHFQRNLPEGDRLHLGNGREHIPGTVELDWPKWVAPDPLPYPDGAVAEIHMYHFLEHLEDPIAMLAECQRVLAVGGVINICVPYYTSQMQAHDLSHKHVFCEETWRNLFSCNYDRLDGVQWHLMIGFNMICGIVERNLCLLTQLIKE